jgi:hypothetical protein
MRRVVLMIRNDRLAITTQEIPKKSQNPQIGLAKATNTICENMVVTNPLSQVNNPGKVPHMENSGRNPNIRGWFLVLTIAPCSGRSDSIFHPAGPLCILGGTIRGRTSSRPYALGEANLGEHWLCTVGCYLKNP